MYNLAERGQDAGLFEMHKTTPSVQLLSVIEQSMIDIVWSTEHDTSPVLLGFDWIVGIINHLGHRAKHLIADIQLHSTWSYQKLHISRVLGKLLQYHQLQKRPHPHAQQVHVISGQVC